VYRFPVEEAVGIALGETVKALKENPVIEEVTFACFGDEVFEAYLREARRLRVAG
jgi:O-acetyl-ADP-ribose deacetylase (regulator of RNase III)